MKSLKFNSLIALIAAVMMAPVACTGLAGGTNPAPVNQNDKSDDPAAVSSQDPSADQPGGEKFSTDGEISGWHCQIFSSDGKPEFDIDMDFEFDDKGRVCQYTEHQILYNSDGTKFSDEVYDRIYNYTSDTHIDYYNGPVGLYKPATWYNLDSEGRISERYNPYGGDNYIYHYDEQGQLYRIDNLFEFEDEEQEKELEGFLTGRRLYWDEGNPMSEAGFADEYGDEVSLGGIMFNYHFFFDNPFRDKVIDPTLTITGTLNFFGMTGKHPASLLTGYYDIDDPDETCDLVLELDDERIVSGMTVTHHYKEFTTSKYVYAFRYFSKPEPMPELPPIIN
ncbi:MAG: hypothetical protein IJ795_00240 [Bacteroidales bacterium]|nr:hypothetical protein [Bacteroidales bacterium]